MAGSTLEPKIAIARAAIPHGVVVAFSIRGHPELS
jgi:hypothetical protein